MLQSITEGKCKASTREQNVEQEDDEGVQHAKQYGKLRRKKAQSTKGKHETREKIGRRIRNKTVRNGNGGGTMKK